MHFIEIVYFQGCSEQLFAIIPGALINYDLCLLSQSELETMDGIQFTTMVSRASAGHNVPDLYSYKPGGHSWLGFAGELAQFVTILKTCMLIALH